MERLPLFERKIILNLAEQRLSAISQAITVNLDREPNPGFMTGLAGQSLFLYHYGRTFGLSRMENLGFLAIERALTLVNDGFNWPSFAAGLAGIRFTLKCLARQGFITETDGSALDDIAPFLQHFADQRWAKGDYDFMHGALGMYLTDLQTIGTGTPEIPNPTADALCAPLAQQAISPGPGYLAWESQHPQTGQPEINLGLAHGIPSILLFLSRTNQGNDPEKLIEQGLNYLLSCRMENTTNGSLFPHRLVDGQPDQAGRLAWCYGDPGVGVALWQIGQNCNRPDWIADGIGILRNAASRRDSNANRVVDACMCHGTAGLSLLFYKMAKISDHDEFINAAEHWTRATLDHGTNPAGAGGYVFLTTGNRFISSYSLLEGIAGVGLTLLALLDTDTMGWEQGLLI